MKAIVGRRSRKGKKLNGGSENFSIARKLLARIGLKKPAEKEQAMATATDLSTPGTRLIDNDDADTFYEVVNGQRIDVPPLGIFECFLAAQLVRFLGSFVAEKRKGRVVGEGLFLLDSATKLQLRPDVAFVSHERWPASRRVPFAESWSVIPDLAVEVVSKSNTADEIMNKMDEYFRAGVRVVWIVYPRQALVHVHTSLTSSRIVDRAGVLDGAPVLPDFRLPLSELFPDEEPASGQAIDSAAQG